MINRKRKTRFFCVSYLWIFLLSNCSLTSAQNNSSHIKDDYDTEKVLQAGTNQQPYLCVDQMPTFPGGEEALFKHITMCLKYPKKVTYGKTYVRFIVTETGSIENSQVIRSLSKICDEEAINVIKTFPNWIPGKVNDKNVAVYYTIPITFEKTPSKIKEVELTADDEAPQFPGGSEMLAKAIGTRIKYPISALRNKIEGEVLVQITITSTGEVINPKIIHSVNSECDAEAIKVVQALPNFIPAKRKGVNIPVYFTIPIKYKIGNSSYDIRSYF